MSPDNSAYDVPGSDTPSNLPPQGGKEISRVVESAASSSPLPLIRSSVVAFLGLDPGRAFGAFFQLPERRLGFEPIDQERAGLERGLAMSRRGGDQHDAVTRLQLAVAMDDENAVE